MKHDRVWIGTLVSALVAGIFCGSLETLRGQDPPDSPTRALTLQERMQTSIPRQLDSVLRMQASIERQRQGIERQTGDQGGISFFATQAGIPTTGKPASALTAAPVETDQPIPKEADNGGTDEIPPPGLIPIDPGLLEIKPIDPISPVPGMLKMENQHPDGKSPAEGSAGGASGVKVLSAPRTISLLPGGTSLPGLPVATGAASRLQLLLRGMGMTGAEPLSALVHQTADGQDDYSGRDKAPLTNFSLMDWLFGL